MFSYIHPRNIPTDFEIDPKIGCRVTGVDGRTDRRRAMVVDLIIVKIQLKSISFGHMYKEQNNSSFSHRPQIDIIGNLGWPFYHQTDP